ncbi:MAG TPA: sodium:proton antiporter [Parabacteroides sp.]|nr:sodium:proton antiporter [Parabacteroides sp.]
MGTGALLAPLIFVVICLVFGAILKSVLKKSKFPYTVALFVFGISIGLLDRFSLLNAPLVKSAIDFAGNMDPDLILYLFLPLLIFDGAYELDLHVFKKSLLNSTLLAGPGLVIAMFMTGALIMGVSYFLPERGQWNWNYALMFGALISATDPVAVVALLKELGTSKRFSTLVDAESMLNDGTGIVLFMLFFGVYSTAGISELPPLLNFILVVFGGALLGWLTARLTIWFLKQFNEDEAVQNSIIIVASYITFILAQSYLNVSGVIALVTFGLTVNNVGRPRLKPEVNKFMVQFWELMAYMANTLIFIIVGVVIALKVDVTWRSLLFLLIVYIGVNIVRLLMILLLFPIMKKTGYGLSHRESFILAWGGLRGALGLTLALMVSYTLDIPEEIRRQILLLTGGIVTLTLAINATTMPWLLQKLGLAKTSLAKLNVDYSIKKQISDASYKYLDKLKKKEALQDSNWEMVEEYLPEKVSAPPLSLSVDILADIRLRVLKKEQKVCWELFNEGIISRKSLQLLLATLSEHYDRDGHLPLSYRNWMFKYYKEVFYIRWFKKIKLVRNLFDKYSHEWVINGYDLGRGFIITQRESMKLIDEFINSGALGDKAKGFLNELKQEIELNMKNITDVLTTLSAEYPLSYRCGVTLKAIRMLLANEKRMINQFASDAVLSSNEAEKMIDDVDDRYDDLTARHINQLLHRFKTSNE